MKFLLIRNTIILPFALEQNKYFSEDFCSPLTFNVLSKFTRPITKIPDLEQQEAHQPQSSPELWLRTAITFLSHFFRLIENIHLQTPNLTVCRDDNKVYNYFHF